MMSKLKLIGLSVLILLLASFTGIYISGSIVNERYQVLLQQVQNHPSVMQLSSDSPDRNFFTTKLNNSLAIQTRSDEVLQINISSLVHHLPWGVSIDSKFNFSSDLRSKAQVAKEFGSSELLSAHTSISPLFGNEITLNSIEINNEQGQFASIQLQLEPEFTPNGQLAKIAYSWQWPGAKLSSSNIKQQFSMSELSGEGELTFNQQFKILLGTSSIEAGNIAYQQAQKQININQLTLSLENSLAQQSFLNKINISANNFLIQKQFIKLELLAPNLSTQLTFNDITALSQFIHSHHANMNSSKQQQVASALLQAGAQLTIKDFSFSLEQGKAQAQLQLKLPASQNMTPMHSNSLFEHLSAQGQALFDQALIDESDLSLLLIAMKQNGYLSVNKKTGKASASISYQNKQLQINDKLVPLL